MTNEDFEKALDVGDHWMNAATDDPTFAALAQAGYTKALAIATWRAAGQVHLLQSAVLEHADDDEAHVPESGR